MANIKVSELNETTIFDDDDYTMIVQNNQNKKISKENMLSDIGDLSNLETSDKTNLVNAINEVNTKKYGKIGLTIQVPITMNEYKKIPYDYTFSLSDGLTLTNDGGIKVSQSGYFLIIARVRLTSFSNTSYIAIRKNNEEANLVVSGVPKPSMPFEISTIVNLNTNDTIYAYAYCSENANIYGGGTPPVWVTLEIISL